MKTKIHVTKPNFIVNPYVVRIDHREMTLSNPALGEFRKILSTSKKIFGATWGYSNPEYEVIGGMEQNISPTNTMVFQMPEFVYRSYWVFEDEMDALQFRLSLGEKAKQVHMWPQKIKFTITEFISEV